MNYWRRVMVIGMCAAQAWGAVERGEVTGWGYNQYGQAYGSPGMEEIVYQAIAAGGDHTLALTTNGTLRAWGLNDYGQVNYPAGSGFEAIAAGSAFCLALSNGVVVGWGDNSAGQLHAPSNIIFRAIAAGGSHAVGLTPEGIVRAWGGNDYGQASVPSGLVCRAVSAGELHSIGIRLDGSLVAWGSNADGQLNCPAGNDYVAVAAGGFHNVALRANGRLVAWGDNSEGQTNCPSGSDFVAVGAGYYHSLALRADGAVVCWGNNSNGQSDAPDGYVFGDIAAGYSHSVALKVPGLTCRFTADRTVGLYQLPVVVSGQTSSTNAINIYFEWDFNYDGVVDTNGFGLNAVAHTYTTGVYSVRLFVSNVLDETFAYLRTNYIRVYDQGVRAGFAASATTGAVPFFVAFTDQSQFAPQYWQWDMDGDGVTDSILQHPTYVYGSAGVYSVTLVVSNNFGAGSGASYDVLTRTNFIVAFAPVVADFTVDRQRVMTNEPVQFTDLSQNDPQGWYWDFDGDGSVDSTNRSPAHAYGTPGYKTVRLTVSNAFGGDSVTRARLITVVTGTRTNYVWEGGSHTAPFDTWVAAATNLQDAVNFVEPGGVVLLSNGVFTSGGEVYHGTNVVAVLTNITLLGNGAAVLDGRGVMRGAYLAHGVLEGVRVRGGAADEGGGLYVTRSAQVARVIVHDSTATRGGGVYAREGAALYSCVLVSNHAQHGGGLALADGAAAYNCTIADNTATMAGGGADADNAGLWNSIVWSNSAPSGLNVELRNGASIQYSCSAPLSPGASNIVADPLFEDGYRIPPESPCVDAGMTFAWAWSARDLDGEPRVRGAAIDMGAYEAVPEGTALAAWLALAWWGWRACRAPRGHQRVCTHARMP